MKSISTCLNCGDRVVGCHSKCEKYLAAKAKLAEEKDKIFREKRKRRLIEDAEIEKRRRLSKEGGHRKK